MNSDNITEVIRTYYLVFQQCVIKSCAFSHVLLVMGSIRKCEMESLSVVLLVMGALESAKWSHFQ